MNSLAELEVIETPSDVSQRFAPVVFRGNPWDLSHLDSFAFRCEVAPGHKVDVVVLFSCHCFTHSFRWDARPVEEIPKEELYIDERETRVLCLKRYELSLLLLRNMTMELPKRQIRIANEERKNFLTWHAHNPDGTKAIYAVFFDVERDTSRRGRVILRIQSAYVLDNGLTKRQEAAKKVRFAILIKAAYEGRKIRA